MSDPALLVSLASVGTLGLAMTAAAALRGWHEWLDLKRAELGTRRPEARGRPELAELRARVRRLEAIADGTHS